MLSSNLSPLLLAVIELFITSYGFPTGAPASVCGTLQPSIGAHGIGPQGFSPYILTVSSNSVEAGQTITGKLSLFYSSTNERCSQNKLEGLLQQSMFEKKGRKTDEPSDLS